MLDDLLPETDTGPDSGPHGSTWGETNRELFGGSGRMTAACDNTDAQLDVVSSFDHCKATRAPHAEGGECLGEEQASGGEGKGFIAGVIESGLSLLQGSPWVGGGSGSSSGSRSSSSISSSNSAILRGTGASTNGGLVDDTTTATTVIATSPPLTTTKHAGVATTEKTVLLDDNANSEVVAISVLEFTTTTALPTQPEARGGAEPETNQDPQHQHRTCASSAESLELYARITRSLTDDGISDSDRPESSRSTVEISPGLLPREPRPTNVVKPQAPPVSAKQQQSSARLAVPVPARTTRGTETEQRGAEKRGRANGTRMPPAGVKGGGSAWDVKAGDGGVDTPHGNDGGDIAAGKEASPGVCARSEDPPPQRFMRQGAMSDLWQQQGAFRSNRKSMKSMFQEVSKGLTGKNTIVGTDTVMR